MGTNPTPELFRQFPELRDRLPWVSLARATQVQRLVRLESYLRSGPVWVKRDDQTSDVHGGGAAREFEFLFGELLRQGAHRVLAFGAVDSDHCLAVTAFARRFDLQPILALVRSSRTRTAQHTLEIEHQLGAELHRLDGGLRALWRLGRSLLGATGEADRPRLPYVVWPRRAALFGALGYVNAAFELKRQINCGILPEPERVYVPVRTGAMAAGLVLGFRLARIQSVVVGVASAGGRAHPHPLAARAARALARRTRRVPSAAPAAGALEMRFELGAEPSAAGPPAHPAEALLRDLESLDLDPGCGARAMTILIQDVRRGRVRGPVLFWHARPTPHLEPHVPLSAEALPREFRQFFVAS